MNGTATTCPSAEAHDDGRDFFRSAKALLPRINSGAPTGAEHPLLHRAGDEPPPLQGAAAPPRWMRSYVCETPGKIKLERLIGTLPLRRAALRRDLLVEFVLGRGLVGAYLASGYFGAEVIFGADGGASYAAEGVDLAYVG